MPFVRFPLGRGHDLPPCHRQHGITGRKCHAKTSRWEAVVLATGNRAQRDCSREPLQVFAEIIQADGDLLAASRLSDDMT